MPRIHIVRSKHFLFLCLFGLTATFLILTMGIDRLRSLGNRRFDDDLSVRSESINLRQVVQQNGSSNNLNTDTNAQLKQALPVSVVNEQNNQNKITTYDTGTAMAAPQSQDMPQGVVDNKPETQNVQQVNMVNSESIADSPDKKEMDKIPSVNSVHKANGLPPIFVPDDTGIAIQESQNKPDVESLSDSVDNKNKMQQADDRTELPKANTGTLVQGPQDKAMVQGPAGTINNGSAIQQNVKVNSEDAKREHNFLDDFSTYPCIDGISVFPPDMWATEGKCVRTVNITESANKSIPNHQCVNVRTAKGTAIPICVYPAAIDKWVSANIVRGVLWEVDLITKMANYIKLVKQKQPDIEFVDLGSNIGCYSLYMAHEGIPVTAIDPLHSNMELISKSILLGKLQDRVKLIWNAVADNHNTVKFIPDTNNVGGTRIKDINPVENVAVMDVARAITFDDLLPLFRGKHIAMKMDIEESEYPALLGGERFFQEVDVKVVQMEFMFHKKGKDGPKILDFFSKKGFQPFRDLQKSLNLNLTQMLQWPNDVYFMKLNNGSAIQQNVKVDSEDAKREHNFLDDFSTYPCIDGISVFAPDRWATEGKCVRTVNITKSANKSIPNHQCVNVRTAKGTVIPICVYPAAIDKWVSANIVRGVLWEVDLITKMANYIKLVKQKQPDIEFVDLGSNIGCYSLYMAHEGIPVTAIDPLHSNMELISKSILLGKLQDRVKLIWNAVADNHNTVKFIPDTNNVGGTRIKDINPVENVAVMDVARAITFDDLLPLFRGKHIAMKMDIEESEYPALLGGERFFQEVDVKVVQMEFMFHKKGKDGPKILEFFSKKGFQPFRDLQKSLNLNLTQMLQWPNDVYFMKPNT